MGLMDGISPRRRNGGYFDSMAHAESEALVAAHQARQARQQGTAEGYDEGFNDGQQSGYDKGWSDGIERGNQELLKADGYIRGHVADKERLQQVVDEQADRIEQLLAHIASLESSIGVKDDAMRAVQESPLPQMARELRAENEQLRSQVQALQMDNDAKAQECAERAWQANRAATVLNAMRNTLEALTTDKKSEHTKEIEHLFCEHYKREVATGLEKGFLKGPLEEDTIFASTMPATHRFLTSVLQAVDERIELNRVAPQADHDDDANWVPDGS